MYSVYSFYSVYSVYYVRCPKILEIQNPWGKVLETRGIKLENFYSFSPACWSWISIFFLEIWNPWGKVMERSGPRFEDFLFKNGLKLPRQKNFFLHFFICSLRLNVFFPPLPKVQCPNFLDFRNPWGKPMERSGIRFEYFCY